MPPCVTGRRSSCAPHGHERRVENRNRKHEQRKQDARQRRPGGRPARRERERGEPEADHLAARVAHEHGRALPRPQVEGQEADTRAAERQGDDEAELARVAGDRVDREDGARDRGERRGQAVHVVEQVEGVRDPDEPHQAERGREQVVGDDLDREPGDEHEAGRCELGRELRDRLQRVEVVGEPGEEEDRAAGDDPAELAARVDRADRERGADSGDEAREDADAAEDGRRALVPALARRRGDQPAGEIRAQQRGEGQRRDRESGDRGNRVHGQTG